MKLLFAGTALVALATSSLAAQETTAQSSTTASPIQAQRQAVRGTVLPANTEVLLSMNQEVTTKGRTWDEGDTFRMSVVHDVMLGDFVVIPAGTLAMGRITWLTSKGAFGKSGKMDIELEYLEMGGRRINIDGIYRQEGEGNTLATVGGVILAGVFAGFVTGRSGRIPQGRELMATTERDLPVSLPEGASLAPTTLQATRVAPVQAVSAIATTSEADTVKIPMEDAVEENTEPKAESPSE